MANRNNPATKPLTENATPSIKLCKCGCGQSTPLATCSQRGRKKGEPIDCIQGHGRRFSPLLYVEEDRGYKTPCHIWQRHKVQGYGRTWDGNKKISAHIFFYEKTHGPVPSGMVLDHLCKIRACVNPNHLEVVTALENIRRSNADRRIQRLARLSAIRKCYRLNTLPSKQLEPPKPSRDELTPVLAPDLLYIEVDTGYVTRCWIWQRCISSNNYGAVCKNNKRSSAHRFMYEKNIGPVPKGYMLDHLCRVPSCVNPDHLEPTTNAENSRRGNRTKLTREQVEALKLLRESENLSYGDLGTLFKIDRGTAESICKMERWVAV